MNGVRGGQSLSGFPEWSPAQRWVEIRMLDRLRDTFELHGFSALSTRAVEPLSQLLRKGETDKEVYVLSRLHDDAAQVDAAADDRLGLHFDLTVPFARYVGENAGRLTFPFKRYQIQPVWRGERPQDGRFREFVQADIDVVAADVLPDHYDVDLPLVIIEALRRLDVGDVVVRTSNRRLTEGYLSGLGIEDTAGALGAIDKLAKIGPAAVAQLLEAGGVAAAQSQACLAYAALRGPRAIDDAIALARRHGAATEMFSDGVARVRALLDAAAEAAPGAVEADLSIARGLDYYTGTVYETTLVGHDDLGSICSGGRYDDLATANGVTYPGVGLSIGVTRLLSRVFRSGVQASRDVATCVLVAVDSEASRPISDQVARALRARGVPADTAPSAAKYGKQIRHADRLGIPFVWFCGADQSDPSETEHVAARQPLVGEIRDIRSGDQVSADASTWTPPDIDRWPSITVQGVVTAGSRDSGKVRA